MKEVNLMNKRKTDEKGFTLIEVIVTLILVGITAAMAGMWIVSVANGYIFAKTNANTVQKAQLAMTRLTKEFTDLRSVTSSNGTGITFNRADGPAASVPVIISMSGTQLLINVNGAGAQTLTDTVSAFSLSYCPDSTGVTPCGDAVTNTCVATWTTATTSPSRSIRIDLTLTGNNTNSKFTQCVTPRNL
jgi:prepilin-type N-terminal cleavage/methylation domain-containing protein